jgi:hypothetical protein
MNQLKHLLPSILLFFTASAFSISLPVAEDTFTTTRAALAAANGKAPLLLLSTNQSALLKFDLSALPPVFNATNVLSATLKIYINRAITPGDLHVFPIVSAWTESVATSAPIPYFDPTPIGTVPATKLLDKRFVMIDVTAEIAAALGGSVTNFGFLLRNSLGQLRIPSKEGPTQGPSAQLEIDANLAIDANGGGSFPGSLNVGANLNLAGFLRQGSETGNAAPAGRGLIMRRLESTNTTAGTIVARTDTLTLERDGTLRGWRIVNTAHPGEVTASMFVINANGGANWNQLVLSNPSTPGTNALFPGFDFVYLRCTFGNSFDVGHQTEVSISCTPDNYSPNWLGTLVSTYNQ